MRIIRNITSSGKNTMKTLSSDMEDAIYSNVKEHYPDSWYEPIITKSLLKELSDILNQRTIQIPGGTIRTASMLNILAEDPDHELGDFGILAKIRYHDGQLIEGAAIFESVKKDHEKNIFSNLKKDVTKRIRSISHHSMLLMYDYDCITGMAFPTSAEAIIGGQPHGWDTWAPYTHAAAVQSNIALELGIKHTGLYKTAQPFSYQLCYRYLFGLDLDFQKTAVDTVKGFKSDRGNPKFLFIISASHGGYEPDLNIEYDSTKYLEIK